MAEAAKASGDPVLLQVDGAVATLTLNQPDKRNAMRPELLEDFARKVEKVKGEADVRVLVVQGSGKIFCSGADFSAMGSMGSDPKKIYGFFLCLLDLDIPTIAKVNGHAIGGGLGLALACDLRVADKDAKLGANFTKLGFTPGMATTYFLPRLVGLPKAAELLFTGRIITGAECEKIGLVNYAVAKEELDARTDALAKEVASSAPLALKLTKKVLYQNLAYDPRGALDAEAAAQAKTMGTQDAREGITAMMQKREPKFTGK